MGREKCATRHMTLLLAVLSTIAVSQQTRWFASAQLISNDDATAFVNAANVSTSADGDIIYTDTEEELRDKGLGAFATTRPNDDPEKAAEIVAKAQNNELSSEMVTNKTRAFISCETGAMIIKLNFSEPFRGVAYADYDRHSPCKLFGEGEKYYEMRLPLKGCGTMQEAPRLFVNNLSVRFHRSLELEDDEVKTIVCRYPPPQTSVPPVEPPVGQSANIVKVPEAAKLTQYEPFVIIAALLFFALLLAGLGTTSYVTRKQQLKTIHTPLPPPPLVSKTEFDSYIDNQSIITVEDLEILHKLAPLPRLDTHIIDETFVTTLHEIDTIEDLEHHMQVLPAPHAQVDYYDDTYITHEDEIIDDEQSTTHLTPIAPSRIEIKTIEDTFITNVDEIIEKEKLSTTHKRRGHLAVQNQVDIDEKYEDYYEHKTDKQTSSTLAGVDRMGSSGCVLSEVDKLQTILGCVRETICNSPSSVQSSGKFGRKFGPKIGALPQNEQYALYQLLSENNSFRSQVLELTSERSVHQLRQSSDNSHPMATETWDLLEAMLVETFRNSSNQTVDYDNRLTHDEDCADHRHYYDNDHMRTTEEYGEEYTSTELNSRGRSAAAAYDNQAYWRDNDANESSLGRDRTTHHYHR